MLLYIAGPVTGIEDDNLPAFEEAARKLRAAGHRAEIPHEFVTAGTWRGAMCQCIGRIAYRWATEPEDAFGLAVLEGWEESRGAKMEKAVAEAMGIPVKTVGEWTEGGKL
ncbi:DUF4406 domain-containing protein [Parvibacter caecicola]|uniref:DUF4406 domain-containing protein n=1 Tax=Parvibacter caecicola TaxID=747645 RepID=A0A7W5D346_9ACTN|nr:DUF4406 domain-containing protein [Parvibacter caecicola]MBB3171778.1 hypothetical protein [Parvibacter caecicola]MCR2040660.1 DUF4406 domain-containing protein [Parvibacter caecicola]